MSLIGLLNFFSYNIWSWICQKTISIQKLELLGNVQKYNLYYFLIHPLKWKLYGFENYTGTYYLMLNFYQINRDCEIRTRDCLVIKALIPYKRTNSTKKFKFLGKILKYNLYYFIIVPHIFIFIFIY